MLSFHSIIFRAAFRKCRDFSRLDRFRHKTGSSRFCKPVFTVLNFSLASGFVVTFNDDPDAEREVKEKITIAEPKEFSNTFQLRQASNNAVDSSTSVLSTSFRTYQCAHQEYATLLESAITVLLTALEVSPAMCEHLGLEEHLSQLQSEMFTQKSLISDSLFVYDESTKLLNLAANISFLVGNETSSALASTHLHNVQQEVYTSSI